MGFPFVNAPHGYWKMGSYQNVTLRFNTVESRDVTIFKDFCGKEETAQKNGEYGICQGIIFGEEKGGGF